LFSFCSAITFAGERMEMIRNAWVFYVLICIFSCKKEDPKVPVTLYTANGDILPRLNEFRAAVGKLNTTPNATGGRREINWDGIADSLLDNALPHSFFNQVGAGIPATFQRGLLYNDGNFQASAGRFGHLNAQAYTQFNAFSGNKVFANVSNAEWPIGFQVAGQSTPATINAFGMVFSDVDVEGSVTLEFYNENSSLGKYTVPAHNEATSFSFFGIHFPNHTITRIIVKHQGKISDGNKDVSQGGTDDLVVIDDIIYSEPVKRQD
jgi:hypothetical protein